MEIRLGREIRINMRTRIGTWKATFLIHAICIMILSSVVTIIIC